MYKKNRLLKFSLCKKQAYWSPDRKTNHQKFHKLRLVDQKNFGSQAFNANEATKKILARNEKHRTSEEKHLAGLSKLLSTWPEKHIERTKYFGKKPKFMKKTFTPSEENCQILSARKISSNCLVCILRVHVNNQS